MWQTINDPSGFVIQNICLFEPYFIGMLLVQTNLFDLSKDIMLCISNLLLGFRKKGVLMSVF